jgi:hypothetical protein
MAFWAIDHLGNTSEPWIQVFNYMGTAIQPRAGGILVSVHHQRRQQLWKLKFRQVFFGTATVALLAMLADFV